MEVPAIRINRAHDAFELALGAWLIASRWVLDYGAAEPAAAVLTIAVGAALIILSLDDLAFSNIADGWLEVALGFALALSPFALDYAGASALIANALVCGVLVIGVASCALGRLVAVEFDNGWQLPRY